MDQGRDCREIPDEIIFSDCERPMIFRPFLLSCLFIVAFSLALHAEIPPQGAKILRDITERLSKGKTTDADAATCRAWMASRSDPLDRQPFALLLSQHLRLKNLRSDLAIEPLLAFLLKPESLDHWIQENKKRKSTQGTEIKRLEIPEIPPFDEWTITEANASLAVEVARCLCALEKPREGLKIIDHVGKEFTNENRVLAAECAADIFIWMKFFDKSVESYRFALNVLTSLKKEERSEHFSDDERKAIRRRIETKLSAAVELYDGERYDPAWLIYRRAREMHVNKKVYFDALCLYKQVIDEFPKSMVAEASKCYQIECLTLLSDRSSLQNTAERLRRLRQELAAAKNDYLLSRQYGEPAGFLKCRRELVKYLENLLATWNTIPTGQRALQEAEKRTEEFLNESRHALYRGEALLTVGLAHLTISLEPEKAAAWLERVEKWFEEIKLAEIDLKAYELPDRVKRVATPPKDERYKDRWTNVRLSQPKPADLFNRRTCKWYLSSKQKDLVLAQGLIAFAKDDLEEARKYWDKLAVLDREFYAEQAESGWSNATTHARLSWNLDNHKTSLYATPEEMKAFTAPKIRLAVLLADLDMENENYKAAEQKFKKLLRISSLRENKIQSSYCHYSLGTAVLMTGKMDDAMEIYRQFGPGGRFEGTPSAAKALLNYANNMTQSTHRSEQFEQGMKCYEYLSSRYADTREGQWAFYLRATGHARTGDLGAAKEGWQRYLAKYPEGGFTGHARKNLRLAAQSN